MPCNTYYSVHAKRIYLTSLKNTIYIQISSNWISLHFASFLFHAIHKYLFFNIYNLCSTSWTHDFAHINKNNDQYLRIRIEKGWNTVHPPDKKIYRAKIIRTVLLKAWIASSAISLELFQTQLIQEISEVWTSQEKICRNVRFFWRDIFPHTHTHTYI